MISPLSKSEKFAFFGPGVPVQFTSGGRFKQCRCIVDQLEFFHGGYGWLQIIGVRYHTVALFKCGEYRTRVGGGGTEDRKTGDKDTGESVVKISGDR